MKNVNKKKILIISPQILPIPAVCGGAVETLITNLIYENEKHYKADFFVTSIFNEKAAQFSFKHTKIFYLKEYHQISMFRKMFFRVHKFLYKLLHNRLTKSLFGLEINDFNFFSQQIASLTHKIKPDSILCDGYNKLHNLWKLIKVFNNKKIFYHLHFCREEDFRLRKIVPNSIAVSKYVLNKWTKTTSDLGKNIVVFNAIQKEAFDLIPREIIELKKKECNIDEDEFVVLFVGRFKAGKGVVELLEGFSSIKNQRLKLLLLGDFPNDQSNREIEFEKRAKFLIASDKRIKHIGMVPNEETPYYYLMSDIQIVPSVYEEAAGLVAIEGMSAGLPLIVTKSGGLPEYTSTSCSIQLDCHDNLSENIAMAIKKLASDPTLRLKMSKESKKRSNMFSLDKYYNEILACLLSK